MTLESALKEIEKTEGKGAIWRMGDKPIVDIDVIPSGNIALDLALGVGGYARGRIVEIYGPESSGKSTLATHAVASAQSMGGICAYIDAEHAVDPGYAQNIGVDVDSLLISQPDNGEQALSIALKLIESGEVTLIVIDSVAALVPRAEIAGDMGDSHVGLQARLMSQACRKMAGKANQTGTTVIFINQIREKIGVMFGCFQYSTRVTLSDGTSEKIGKIVNQHMDVEVLSYDETSGKVVPSRVVGWHDNGNADFFYQIETERGYGSGRSNFACTPNHVIITPQGERHAEELQIGDEILHLTPVPNFSDDQIQILLGALLGDGSLRAKSTATGVSVRFGHGTAQEDYLRWKHQSLGEYTGKITPLAVGSEFATVPSHEFMSWMDAGKKKDGAGQRDIPQHLIDSLDQRALTILCLDDGSFSGSHDRWGWGKFEVACASLTADSKIRLASRFEVLGMGLPTVRERTLLWSGERTQHLMESIAPFAHPSMEYKIHPKMRGTFTWNPCLGEGFRNETVVQHITAKYVKPHTRSMKKFDITVEGEHNYFVDGVLVHNSPEVTPGGRALKFYSSQRLDIRRKEQIKNGVEVIGNKTLVKVVKNKVAPPFRTAEFNIMYGEGMSSEATLLEFASEYDVIKKSGVWYYDLDGTLLGQGLEAARLTLKGQPDMVEMIYKKTMQAIYGGNDES